jgi:hypothetical protein
MLKCPAFNSGMRFSTFGSLSLGEGFFVISPSSNAKRKKETCTPAENELLWDVYWWFTGLSSKKNTNPNCQVSAPIVAGIKLVASIYPLPSVQKTRTASNGG